MNLLSLLWTYLSGSPAIPSDAAAQQPASLGSSYAWPGPTLGAPIMFLDFDGVLHPGQSETFEFMPDLYRVLDAIPDLEIVVSSTWRFTETGEGLRRLFDERYKDRVRDVCGPELSVQHGRQAEIEAYAYLHGTRRFIAVDDRQDLFRPDCPWLVLVPRLQGLSGEHSSRVIAALAVPAMSPS